MLGKIVLTGARGNLGHELRAPLAKMCRKLVSTDILNAPDTLADNETYVRADVAQMDQIGPLIEGAEMVVHFGAIVDEKPFPELLGPNFVGAYNVWEAAFQHGARRVIYASSVHAVGMCETNAGIDTNAPHRPDTFYGLAKCFSEDLGRMYWEKRGLESVCLRIMSCTPEPQNVRALQTWLSYRDMVQLVVRSVQTATVGHTIVYGVSANTRAPVSNHKVGFLGYRPQDNAEDWADRLLAKGEKFDPQNPAHTRLGGPFASVKLGESGIAGIKAMSGGASTQESPKETGKLPAFLSRKGIGAA